MADSSGEHAHVEELEAKLRFLLGALHAGRVGTWRSNVGPEALLELSDDAYRLFGLEPGSSIRNVDAYRMVHPEDRERFVETIIAARAEHERREFEVRLVGADGIERLLVITAAPVYEQSASVPVATTGTIAEATSRRRLRAGDEHDARLTAEAELRRAIEDEELFLEYQPIHSFSTGTYSGAEALVRWQHPTRGCVFPVDFVGLAEESGLIHRLGSWALKRACQDLRVWLDAGIADDFVVGVNLSAIQLHAPGLPSAVDEILNGAGVSPSNVLLEVTETVLVEGTIDERSLRSIRDLGVHVAIDDFGTEYATLAYLARLPVDALKMDAAFVQGIGDEAGRAVVAAIAAVGHALGLRVIAEGVETAAQLDAVRESGCDSAQGFFISRPLLADRCLATVLAGGNGAVAESPVAIDPVLTVPPPLV